MISKVKKRYWRTTHKYGVRLPNNLTEAMQIYQANGNTYCKGEIDKEMKKAKIAYKPREDSTPEKVRKGNVDDMHGYQEITCHDILT